MKEELKEYLLSEEKHAFEGWDFSYLNNRVKTEELPWSYNDYVKKYLKDADELLDIGTGGGEVLLNFHHPYNKTSITEAYEPNIKLCLEKLKPKGIKVFPIKQDDILTNVPSNTYDIVLSRHESYNEEEIKRVLKQNGIFITQQVGAYNNSDLASFFDSSHKNQFPDITKDKLVDKLIKAGFEIVYANEYFPKTKYLDLGAVVYFAKIINWEFINFKVIDNLDKLDILNNKLKQDGFIASTEHRIIIIAKNK